jgi:hypothetical protein
VLFWGRPRFTADVDVTVRLDPERPRQLVTELERAGFALRVSATDDFVTRTRVLPFVHGATGLPLDIVLAGPGLEERFISRAVVVDLGAGVPVPVICAEDLVVTKILAGRPKDIEDVQGVLIERLDRLDVGSIRETLGWLEQALSIGDLLPAFEGELTRARSRRPSTGR